MTDTEIVERIEQMFESQLDGSDLHDALRDLQEDLIGADALASLLSARFKAYQDAHPWLYPAIYGPVEPPEERNVLLKPSDISLGMLELLRARVMIDNS